MSSRVDDEACAVRSRGQTVTLFELDFERVTLEGAVAQISRAAEARMTGLVVTPNVDQIVGFRQDRHMHRVYREAMHVYADGMPIVWLSRLLDGEGLPARVTGADLLPAVCEAAERRSFSVYFFGGDPGVADAAAAEMQRTYPGLNVAGTHCPPWGFEHDETVTNRLIDEINAASPDVLFLGVGAPKQEKWGHRHQARLQVGPIVCVGAAFAFAAGAARRAPRFLQESGFEWCWRLAMEPRRLWRRYLIDDTRFFAEALREMQSVRRARRNETRRSRS